MQTGYSLNKAVKEFEAVLLRTFGALTTQESEDISAALLKVLDAAIGFQSHPGSPLTNS